MRALFTKLISNFANNALRYFLNLSTDLLPRSITCSRPGKTEIPNISFFSCSKMQGRDKKQISIFKTVGVILHDVLDS